ncbi:MAG TPA: AI-2E family transporter [Candidatus Acidoferrum sp.]|jgi:predicted PurR-regulated permease PerM|nr:AI-2E family transporter [Candidatus Acidoferrum sp.]
MTFPPPTDRQARLMWLALSGLALASLVALAVGFIWGLGHVLRLLSPVLWPLAVAGVLAYLLDPLVDFFERKSASRPRAILVVFGLALVIILGLFAGVVPQLVTETRQLVDRIPAYATRLGQRAENWINHPPPLLRKWLERSAGTAPPTTAATDTNAGTVLIPPNTAVNPGVASTNAPSFLATALGEQDLQTAAGLVADTLRKAGSWLFGRVASWFGVLAGLALIPVYTFYFLLEKRGISSRWTDYLPVSDSGFKRELVFVLNSMNNYLIAYFRGQVLVATCDGVLYGLGFLIIGLPYALLIGAMAILLTMVPFLGAIITCLAALIIALVQFGDWLHPLLVLVVFGCVQLLEAVVISPKIMGGRVGLHPLAIIIAVMAGTTLLGGLLGGILAIPLTAALRVIMFRYVWKRPATA